MLRALIFTTFIRCALGSFVNESVTCVIMALNDVYKYFHLSQVASAKRNENPHYLVSLGDFTGPSPHSFFDSGRGMHNLFNSIGVNLTIFGNHETDDGMDKLCEHVKESKMQWLSSNMHLQCPGLPPLPTYTIVPMEGKRVAFVGLLSNDMSLYDPGSDPFGGAVIEDPIVVAAHLHDFLMETENVDAVVFLTHQSLEDDVRLALSGNYSVIMGGHDDDEYVGQVNGCWVIKGGMNAVKYELVKLFWPDANATHPTVSVELKLSALHEADPQTQELSEQQHANAAHMGLGSIVLGKIPDVPLPTSKFVRTQQTGLTGWLLDYLVLSTPGAVGSFMCGGNVRADKDFISGENFTFFNLVEIFPFKTNFPVLVNLSGAIIAETVRFSRTLPTLSDSRFLQLDGGMRWDNVTQTLTHIAREPVDPDRIYTLVVNEQLLRGMDALHVLLDYLRAHPEAVDISQPRVEIKARLASHWLGELSANKMLPSDLLQISVDGNIQLPAASNLPLHKHLVGETFAL